MVTLSNFIGSSSAGLESCFIFLEMEIQSFATANLKIHETTLTLTYHSFADSEQLKNSFFKRVVRTFVERVA